MRAPLVALNALVAVWLVVAISRQLSLRPVMALVAALPFIMPTPATSNQLLETAGACVEPFVYVLLLWQIRRRPLAFGALLAIAFLHREFVIFAVPAIVLADRHHRSFATRASVRHAATVLAGFGLVYLVVDDLKMHLSGGALALQAASLRNQMCFDAGWFPRARSLVTEALPVLFGGAPIGLQRLRMNTPLVTGHWWVGGLVAATLVVTVARIVATSGIRRERAPESGFGVYLAWIGAFTASAYPLSCNVIPGMPPLLRYLLLAILLPVGCAAIFFSRGTPPTLRAAVATMFVVWAGVNLFDNVRLVAASIAHPPVSEHRVLADYLIGHRIRYARAIYWDAYILDFLTRERVTVASVDIVRIADYQRQVDEHADSAVRLERLPCEGGERVASWCITR
jgi:hypothetical protein